MIGAHPGDCELKAGGSAALWVKWGHEVRFVSATDGRLGHHSDWGANLAARRWDEADAAGSALGVEYHVLEIPDGHLEANLLNRREFVYMIRAFEPDLVLTHRPSDSHPDRRMTAQLVQDAVCMVTVPGFAPEMPHLPQKAVLGHALSLSPTALLYGLALHPGGRSHRARFRSDLHISRTSPANLCRP